MTLPDWGIANLRAKVDTGARTSAIHVQNLQEIGDRRIRFEVVLDRQRRHLHVVVESDVVRISHVRSSTGENLPRYFVTTRMRLGPVEKVIEVSLVNRDNMNVRMLIGRTSLGDDFLVDAHQTYMTGRNPQ